MKNVKILYMDLFNNISRLPFCQNTENGTFSHERFSKRTGGSHEKKVNSLIVLSKSVKNGSFYYVFCEQILQTKFAHEKKLRKMLKTPEAFVIIEITHLSENGFLRSLKFEKPDRQ